MHSLNVCNYKSVQFVFLNMKRMWYLLIAAVKCCYRMSVVLFMCETQHVTRHLGFYGNANVSLLQRC
jgi:hypothetical protein